MADTIASLQAIIGADVSGALNGLGQLKKGLSDTSDQLRSAGATLTASVTVPVIGFMTAAVKAASDNQTAMTQLNAVIKSTGGAAGVTATAAANLADKLALSTRFSKDQTLQAEDMLLTFTSVNKNIFPQTISLAQDLSTAMNQDLKSSIVQIGKALNDPVAGMAALRRVGVEFTEAQKEQVKQLMKTGDLQGAQKIILQELQKEFGGSAQAAGTTFAGQMDILNHKFEEFQVRVGNLIIPILQKFLDVLSQVVGWLEKLPTPVLQAGLAFAAFLAAIGPVLGILGSLGTVLGFLLSPIGLVIAAVVALAAAWATDFGGIREKVMPIINEFVSFITKTVIPGIQKLWTDIQPYLIQLRDWFVKDAIPAIQKAINDFITGYVNPLISILKDIWTLVGPELQKFGNWFITDEWPQITKLVGDFYTNVLEPVINAFATLWSLVSPGLTSFASWFHTELPTIQLMLDHLDQTINLILLHFGLLNHVGSGGGPSVNLGPLGGIGASANLSGGGSNSNVGAQIVRGVVGGILGPGSGAFANQLFGGFGSHASGGYVASPQLSGLAENGPEYVVPQGGALVSKGGGNQTIHIVLQADGFAQHLYAQVANGMAAGS